METTRILFNDMIIGKNTNTPKVHWANDFVNLASDLKIVKGYPSQDGKGFEFHPDIPITRAEAVTLIMKAYESLEEKIATVQKSINDLK
jgi:hypothetical protein